MLLLLLLVDPELVPHIAEGLLQVPVHFLGLTLLVFQSVDGLLIVQHSRLVAHQTLLDYCTHLGADHDLLLLLDHVDDVIIAHI